MQFVKEVGSGTGASPIVITVPAAGVAASNKLFIASCLDSTTATITGIADSKSNTTYAQVSSIAGTGQKAFLWSGNATIALVNGDTITITFSGGGSVWAGQALEFSSDVTLTTDGVAASGGGGGLPSSGPISQTQFNDVLIGVNNIEGGAAFTEATGSQGGDTWHGHTEVLSGSGRLHMAHKITTDVSPGQAYSPSNDGSGGGETIIAAFKGPLVTTLLQYKRLAWQQRIG